MSSPIVELKNVTWKQERQPILQNVSWEIEPGQHWALIGNNGSGKTSLLNIINGYLWPSSGSVSVLGYQFGKASLHDMRQLIGWVSASFVDKQLSGHPEDTVLEVVVSGRYSSIGIYNQVSSEDVEAATEALEQFHCTHLSHRTFQSLSQGEKQRIILARSIVRKPRLLILDEPCTGLDLAAREALLNDLQAMINSQQNITLIYVTHHIEELIPAITHVMALRTGSVVDAGGKKTVLTSQVLSRTFAVPAEVSWTADRPWIRIGP